jgi:hypothetical protein
MTIQDNQRIFLENLCKRWQKDVDQVLELAITGKVTLWVTFSDIFLQNAGKAVGAPKKRKPVVHFHSQVDMRPSPEVLSQLQGRYDRLLFGAEFSCLDAKGKAVAVTNSVGGEWGETSMIGLNPTNLFARMDKVIRFERQYKIVPHEVPLDDNDRQGSACGQAASLNNKEHQCFAEELHIAFECWQALFAQACNTGTMRKKGDILMWLKEKHPNLSCAAAERIALVVTPRKIASR